MLNEEVPIKDKQTMDKYETPSSNQQNGIKFKEQKEQEHVEDDNDSCWQVTFYLKKIFIQVEPQKSTELTDDDKSLISYDEITISLLLSISF